LDNSGLEVFVDLCLADFMLSNSLADKVVFHGKVGLKFSILIL
jgi:hypothetical protein